MRIRFLAAAELKLMLAHLLINYDVALDGGVKPELIRRATAIRVDKGAKILFKRRKMV